jgi:hypothetical protein
MSYGVHRYLYENLITSASMISPSSQAAGRIGGALKDGDGSAVGKAGGSYTGDSNIIVTVQIDAEGTGEIGSATFRHRTNETAAGSWEASGTATSTSYTSLTGTDGVEFAWEQGSGQDVHLDDSWTIPVTALYGPQQLLSFDRDLYWKSGALGDNLLSNGDFESGFTGGLGDGWAKYGASQTYADEISEVHGGSHAQKITCVADDEPIGISQAESITAGNEYYIEFWVYCSTGMDVKSYNPNVDSGGTDTTAVTATTWTKISWYGTGTTTGSNSFYFYVAIGDCTVADYIILDDIRVFSLHYIDIDLGSAQEITAILLQDHNLTSDATLILKGNSSASWASPGYEKSDFTVTDDPIIEYDGDTYHYWRFIFQDVDNSDDYHSVGKLYLGTYLQLVDTTAMSPWESTLTLSLNKVSDKSKAGIRREHALTEQRMFTINPFYLSPADWASWQTLFQTLYNLSTRVISGLWIHYFYDEDDTIFLCRCVSNLTRTFFRYQFNKAPLEFEEIPITRTT